MSGNQTINFNSECFKEVWNFGSTIYQNICNNSVHTVAWGNLDWVLNIALIIIGIAVVFLLILLLLKILFI